jgi:hypothetical protein
MIACSLPVRRGFPFNRLPVDPHRREGQPGRSISQIGSPSQVFQGPFRHAEALICNAPNVIVLPLRGFQFDGPIEVRDGLVHVVDPFISHSPVEIRPCIVGIQMDRHGEGPDRAKHIVGVEQQKKALLEPVTGRERSGRW